MPIVTTFFHRHPGNPILTADRWPHPVHTVFKAGATRLGDGTTLLCGAEDPETPAGPPPGPIQGT